MLTSGISFRHLRDKGRGIRYRRCFFNLVADMLASLIARAEDDGEVRGLTACVYFAICR